jgi:hypothetical protein
MLRTIALIVLILTNIAIAARIDGASLALKSGGEKSEKCWTLSRNGFVGTFIRVAKAGDVEITVEAAGDPNADAMMMIGPSGMRLELTEQLTRHGQKFPLAAGMHFIRIEHRQGAEKKAPMRI